MFWRNAVQLCPRGIALLAQTRDEHLLKLQPLVFRDDRGARCVVIEHVLNRLHVGNEVIELQHRGRDWVHV